MKFRHRALNRCGNVKGMMSACSGDGGERRKLWVGEGLEDGDEGSSRHQAGLVRAGGLMVVNR